MDNMNIEHNLKAMIGDLVFQLIQAQTTINQLAAQLTAFKEQNKVEEKAEVPVYTGPKLVRKKVESPPPVEG